jgi:signal transduction histidine kinase
MDYNIINNLESCYVPVSSLLYYSHIATAMVALAFSAFAFWKNRSLATVLLLGISISFTLWNIVDLILWISVDGQKIMAFWSAVYLLQTLILAFTWYFSRVFIEGKDIVLRLKLTMALLLLPLIVLMPTTWNLSGFDAVNCEAKQGVLVQYFYFFQVVVLLWIFIYLISKYQFVTSPAEKKKVGIFGIGIFLFLVSFSWGNVFGSLTLQWGLEQYGLFGMPVFIGFLSFLIVRYQAFDMKLLGSQALVVGLVVLIGSQFFFIQTTTNFILTGITFIMAVGFGWMLIRSVRKEVMRKDELQEMSDRLARANDELRKLDNAKSEFISIASHQLRTPLTAIKGFLSLILEGSYGKISPEVQDILNKVYASNDRIVQLVENLLNISRIESGRIQYQFQKSSIEDILKELSDMFFVMAKNKNLTLTFTLPKKKLPLLYMDSGKIREVVSNLIDNAFKYTEKGGVEVILEQKGPVARITVSDTGMGIEAETMPHLFSKFIRGSKEASRMNVAGTGLGLYVGKSFIEAHHGRIWIESDGKGKGSRFIVELPIV